MARIRFFLLAGLSFGLLMVIAASSNSIQAQQAQIDRYILPGDKVFPEGIAYQESTGDFYVSNTTDGTIYKGNIARPEAEVWLPGATEGLTGTRGMKVSSDNRLYVSAGPQAMIFVFDTTNKQLVAKFPTGVQPSFVNDVSLAPDGAAYFTDSNSPRLYKVSADAQGKLSMEDWLNVSPTIVYTQGFNLGGIDVSDDGKYIIVAQGNTGKIYRIEVASKSITEINLGGQAMTGADGILLDGQTLYIARNSAGLLVTIAMSNDMASGTVVSSATDPSFGFPTTLAKAGNRLLVVNSQFDKRATAPVLPFTISSIPAPSSAQPQPTAPAATVVPAETPVVTETPVPAPAPVETPVTPGMPTTGSGGSGDLLGLTTLLILATALVLQGGVMLRRAKKSS